MGGVKLSARHVMEAAARFGGALEALGTEQHDRVATLLENSPARPLAWAGTVCSGGSPCRSTPPTRASTCRTS